MRHISYISYVIKLPIFTLVKKSFHALIHNLNTFFTRTRQQSKDCRVQTYTVNTTIGLSNSPRSPNSPPKLNILGAVPSNLYYNEVQPGFEGIQYNHNLNIDEFDKKGNWLNQVVRESHVEYSKAIWELIQSIQPNYNPIDWQKDIKTGFRWDAKIWHKDQGKLMKGYPGVDIKNPWEVSRLQHLPIKCLSAKTQQGKDKLATYEDVVCQLLDFVMANPIGMGVNFNCPMDIGIRHANMLICLDYIKQDTDSSNLLSKIEPILGGYISESTKHILNNLEYRTGLTSNHYLANVLGTLFAGAYLNNESADSWLLFSIQEIEKCMDRQFFNDGSNFEGSTSYHRLSGEMMLWTALVVLSLPEERIKKLQDVDIKRWMAIPKIRKEIKKQIASNAYVFSSEFWKKLIKAIRFTDSITKQDGTVFQFGDNDSGRFIKLSQTGQLMTSDEAEAKYLNVKGKLASDEAYWDEKSLDHSAFVSAGVGLFDIKTQTQNYSQPELDVFKAGPTNQQKFLDYIKSIDEPSIHKRVDGAIKEKGEFHKEKHLSFEAEQVDFTKNNSIYYHEDFQLAVIKNNSFSIALAGISNPNQHHSLGHTHNDKLAIELQVNGKDILFNPGTYLYTPKPEARYTFRSVKSHNTVSVNDMEQNRPLSGGFGLFNLKIETKFQLIKLTETEIIAEVRYRKIIHQRRIEIKPKAIIVHDWCNHKFEQHWNTGAPYSNGYGKRLA